MSDRDLSHVGACAKRLYSTGHSMTREQQRTRARVMENATNVSKQKDQ